MGKCRNLKMNSHTKMKHKTCKVATGAGALRSARLQPGPWRYPPSSLRLQLPSDSRKLPMIRHVRLLSTCPNSSSSWLSETTPTVPSCHLQNSHVASSRPAIVACADRILAVRPPFTISFSCSDEILVLYVFVVLCTALACLAARTYISEVLIVLYIGSSSRTHPTNHLGGIASHI